MLQNTTILRSETEFVHFCFVTSCKNPRSAHGLRLRPLSDAHDTYLSYNAARRPKLDPYDCKAFRCSCYRDMIEGHQVLLRPPNAVDSGGDFMQPREIPKIVTTQQCLNLEHNQTCEFAIHSSVCVVSRGLIETSTFLSPRC